MPMSCLIYLLEADRRNGTLDIQFGKRLLQASEGLLAEGPIAAVSDNDVLRTLFRAMELGMGVTVLVRLDRF
jgi:hypothetical protein